MVSREPLVEIPAQKNQCSRTNRVGPDRVLVDLTCQGLSSTDLHASEYHVYDDNQASENKGYHEDRIQECHITQLREIVGDREVEGDEDQQVATADINTFTKIVQEEGCPRDQNNDGQGE